MSCVWKPRKGDDSGSPNLPITLVGDAIAARRQLDRRKAEKLAEHYEAAYARKRTARQIREVISAAHAEMTGEQLINKSFKIFFGVMACGKAE